MSDSCETCSAYHPVEPAKGICRANPPHATALLMPHGSVAPKLAPVNLTVWPTVEPHMWCRQHVFKSAIALSS